MKNLSSIIFPKLCYGLVGVFVLSFFLPALSTQGYFQATFECSFLNDNLQISTTAHPGSKNCMDLIAQLKVRKSELLKQIEQIQTTSNYNQAARVKLIKQRSEVDVLIGQLVSGINNLETKLHTSYKKKYFTKLKLIRTKLISKQAVLSADQASFINNGERKLMENIVKTIGFNYQRLKLIEGILSSQTLDEMLPLLDTYESLITTQLAGNSE